MNELKECPFCGGEAEFYRTPVKINGRWCDSVVVRCKNCEARTRRMLYDAKKHPNDEEYNEAAAAWNQRKPMERIVEELKNLKKCYNGEEDAVMKPMGFHEYIQEIIDLAEEGELND